jgi:hypothetical protein
MTGLRSSCLVSLGSARGSTRHALPSARALCSEWALCFRPRTCCADYLATTPRLHPRARCTSAMSLFDIMYDVFTSRVALWSLLLHDDSNRT